MKRLLSLMASAVAILLQGCALLGSAKKGHADIVKLLNNAGTVE